MEAKPNAQLAIIVAHVDRVRHDPNVLPLVLGPISVVITVSNSRLVLLYRELSDLSVLPRV